jgi:hypothetical protein
MGGLLAHAGGRLARARETFCRDGSDYRGESVKRSALVLLGLALLLAALAPSAGAQGRQSLDMYTARMSAGKATDLVRKGYDVAAIRHQGGARRSTWC